MTHPTCAFCGLPVSAGRGTVVERNPQPIFCCYGCEFAAQVTRSTGGDGANRVLLLRIGFAAFCTMNVLAFTMVLWSHDVYPGSTDTRAALLDDLLRYLGLLFSIPVWFVLGQPLMSSAFGKLRRGIPATDFLVCLGVIAAFAFSIASTWRGTGAVYYEVACVTLILITLGRWLESQGKLQASLALEELDQLLPVMVRVLQEGQEVTIPLADVRPGHRLMVRAGECISVDGVISEGCAHIDERLLTGESWPVEKHQGDSVRAGAFNLDGNLLIAANSTVADGSLGRLVQGLRDARQNRGQYERLTERVTAWFLPAIILIALATIAWHSSSRGIEHGIMAGLSVLLIACPCALGLATPLAAWTAFGHAVRKQVLFRGGEALERLADIRVLAWDKTGTLTTPDALLSSLIWNTDVPNQVVLMELLELARSSNHPFSRALVSVYGQGPRMSCGITGIQELSGRGMVGKNSQGLQLCLGNQQLMDDLGLVWPSDLRQRWMQLVEDSQSVVIGGAYGLVQCLLVISETLRPGVAMALSQVHGLGIRQHVITGDQATRTARLLREIFAQIPPQVGRRSSVVGEVNSQSLLSPDGKASTIRHLREMYGAVGMIGDGVNDALALTDADVGIALRSGADISRDSASVCLFSDDISRVPWAISYARFTVRIIRQNLAWAFGYNTVGVGLAATGLLNPSLAAVLMVGSSVFVIANTWRLNFSDSSDNLNLAIQSGENTPSEALHSVVAEHLELNPILHKRMSSSPVVAVGRSPSLSINAQQVPVG